MSEENDHSPAFPTWVLKTNAYPKKVIPKDGLVFEMALLDGRYAIGFILIAKYGGFRAPLTEILALCDSDYDPKSIDQDWVNRHHADPFLPPICIEPAMFSTLRMAKRIGLLKSPVTNCDVLQYDGFTRLDPAARVFVPDKFVGDGKYVPQDYSGDMSDWEVIDCHNKFHRLGDIQDRKSKLVVPNGVPLAGKYDLHVARMLAFEDSKELPSVERSKFTQQEF